MLLESQKKARLNLEFSQAVKDNLTDLKKRSGCPTLNEVIRKSLALLDLVITHNEGGGTFVLRHKDGREETVKLL
jgi:hypothetical protein